MEHGIARCWEIKVTAGGEVKYKVGDKERGSYACIDAFLK